MDSAVRPKAGGVPVDPVASYQSPARWAAVPDTIDTGRKLKSLEKVDAFWLSLVIPKEFVEIFNTRGEPQDLSGFKLRGNADYNFPPGTVIADAAEELIHKLNARLGHSEAAE